MIHANEELKISLDRLTQKIKEISEILEKSQNDTRYESFVALKKSCFIFFQFNYDVKVNESHFYSRFLSGSDLGAILREDERVLSGIRDFIRSRFEAAQEDPNFHMGGQEQQEFESLVEEVDRVRFSYAGEQHRH